MMNFSPRVNRYLNRFRKALNVLPASEQTECVNELQSQIYECLQAGESETQILERLGKPEVYALPFIEEHIVEIQEQQSVLPDLRFIQKQVLGPCLTIVLLFVGIMLFNTLYIFSDLLVSSLDALMLIALSLPAIIVVVLPVLTLWILPLYIFKVGKRTPARTLKSYKVWAMTLFLGLSMSGASFFIQDVIVPRSNTRTVELLKTMVRKSSDNPDMTFIDRKDVRQMGVREAYAFLDGKTKTKEVRRSLVDYYTKFSLPLLNFAAAFFGLLTASLMLSGVFHPYYTLFSIGTLLPLAIVYVTSFGNTGLDSFRTAVENPFWQAFLPNLVLLGMVMFILPGLLLPHNKNMLENEIS